MVNLSLLYAALFALVGTHMPYWPVWLSAHGLTPTQISVLTALSFGLKIGVTPPLSAWADRKGKKREVTQFLSFGLCLSSGLFFFAHTFWSLLLVTIFVFSLWSPLMSLVESIANLSTKQHGYDYGKMRVWGSVSFMIVAIGVGYGTDRWGPPVILFSFVAAACFLAGASSFMADEKPVPFHQNPAGLRVLFQYSWMIPFLLATSFIQGSHAAYYTFGTLFWQANHISDQMIGLLWGISLMAEIAFFFLGRRLLVHAGAVNVLLLSAALAGMRWVILGSTLAWPWLGIAQLSHGFTFGAAHAAAMRFLSEHIPPAHMATAQGIYSAVVMGIGIGTFIFASGPLFEILGGNIFYVMALLASAGGGMAYGLRRKMGHIG